MTADKEARASVLASLTAEVMADKKTEARKLTPVAGEAGAPRIADEVAFLGHEEVESVIRELRRAGNEALAAADRLELGLGKTPEDRAAEKAATDQKLAEREADRKAADREKAKAGDAKAAARVAAAEPVEGEVEAPTDFAAAFAAKQAEAQAQVFGKPAAAEPEAEWKCPTHDKVGVAKTSKAGRPFIGCPDCNQFKRA